MERLNEFFVYFYYKTRVQCIFSKWETKKPNKCFLTDKRKHAKTFYGRKKLSISFLWVGIQFCIISNDFLRILR